MKLLDWFTGGKHRIAVLTGSLAGILLPLLSLRVSPVAGLAALAGIAVAGWALAQPTVAVLLTALVVPIERLGRFSNDSQMMTISLMRIFGLLGLASLGLHWMLGRLQLRLPAPILFYALYVAIAGASLTWATDLNKGVSYWITIVGNLLFMILVVNVIRSRAQIRLPVVLWLVTTLGVGVFSIYQWHDPSAVVQVDRFDNTGERTTDERFSTVMEDYAEFEAIGTVRRVLGATSHPAVYGINIILAVPFYVYLIRSSSSLLTIAFGLAGLAVGAYNVLLTNTRAALLTLLFAAIMIMVTGLVRIRPLSIVCVLLAGILMIPFLPATLYDRILDANNYSTSKSAAMRIRITYWEAGLDILRDHWFLGLGIGNQSELPKRLAPIMAMPANTSIHNEYFQCLLETGLIGYPFIVAFMVVLYRRCALAERYFAACGDREGEFFIKAARVGYFCVLFFALQADVLHFTLKGWWLAMGICIAMSELPLLAVRQARQEQPVMTISPSLAKA
jgi:hypothetical protein